MCEPHAHTPFTPFFLQSSPYCYSCTSLPRFLKIFVCHCFICPIREYILCSFGCAYQTNRHSPTHFPINRILKCLQMFCEDTLISRKKVLAPFAVAGICPQINKNILLEAYRDILPYQRDIHKRRIHIYHCVSFPLL